MGDDIRSLSRLDVVARWTAKATLAALLFCAPLVFSAQASAAPDPDQDGLSTVDEEVIGSDPFRYDTDMDGLNDFQEVTQSSTDPIKADTDGDGVNDGKERDNNTDPRVSDRPASNLPAVVRSSVLSDVDVYDVPGGDGNVIGMLDGRNDGDGHADHVQFFTCQGPVNSETIASNSWCQIGFGGGPGGKAWVWGELLGPPK